MTFPSVNSGIGRVPALAVGSLVLFAGALGAQPIDNPVTTAFPGEYAWTNALKWGTVTTTAANGADTNDDLDVVTAEIAAIAAAGGGVLYFPAGNYYFRDHLVLKSGVIIRGQTPVMIDAREAAYDPQTNFWFPKFEWSLSGDYSDKATRLNLMKKVKVEEPASASRYGIVNVDIQRAIIDFVARYNVTSAAGVEPEVRDYTDDFATYFGTGVKNRLTGGEVVVYGNRLNNASTLDPRVPNITNATSGSGSGQPRQNRWQVWFNRGHGKIDVQVTDYVIIANNRIGDIHWQRYVNDKANAANWPVDDFQIAFQSPSADTATARAASYLRSENNSRMPREMFTAGTTIPETIPFVYSDGYGILANRASRTGFGRMNTPVNEPMIYRKGVTVRRNWVYTTQRVGIQAGGDGLEVIDNVKLDDAAKTIWMSATGDGANTNNSATYENRSLDVTGTNIVVRGNNLFTSRHTFPASGYQSIDGEGILVQDNNAGWITGWRIEDNVTNSYIGIYKVWFIRDMVIKNNTITAGNILIDADDNGSPSGIYDLEVSGNSARDGIVITGGIVGRNIKVTGNTSSGGTIRGQSYGTFNDLVYTATDNTPAFTTFDGSVSGTPIPVPADNAIDRPPVVEILVPTRDQVLVPGETMTVQVKVTLDPDGAGIPVQEVRFYDGSGLTRDYKQDFVNWYTGANAIPATGYVILSDGDADGIYTGSWTVPTSIPLKQVFPAVEARLAAVTVKNTKVAGGPNLSYNLRSYAFLDVGSPNRPADPVPPGFASWRTEFSLPAGKDGLLDDADGDGVPNLLEYAFGMNPTAAAGAGDGPQVGREVVGGTPYVTYAFGKSASGELQYVTQIASSLVGPWNPVTPLDGILVEETSSAVIVKVPQSLAGAFLRVNVSVAP